MPMLLHLADMVSGVGGLHFLRPGRRRISPCYDEVSTGFSLSDTHGVSEPTTVTCSERNPFAHGSDWEHSYGESKEINHKAGGNSITLNPNSKKTNIA